MRTILCILLTIFLNTSYVLQADYSFDETVYISLPQLITKWKIGYQNNLENGSSVIRYIPEHETIHAWTQLVNIQFKDRALIKCTNAVEAMRRESTFNQWVTYKVYTQTPNDLIYEKVFPTGEHELVRMIMTKKGLHRIAYAKRDAPFTDPERSQWIERLSQGTLEMIE